MERELNFIQIWKQAGPKMVLPVFKSRQISLNTYSRGTPDD